MFNYCYLKSLLINYCVISLIFKAFKDWILLIIT